MDTIVANTASIMAQLKKKVRRISALFFEKMIDKPVFYDRVKDALLWSSMDY